MVRVLILKRLYNLSGEQVDYSLSFQPFCQLSDSANATDGNTAWQFAQRIGVDGAATIFQALVAQMQRQGYIARAGQLINSTLVSAPIQHLGKEEKAQLEQGQIPQHWSDAKRGQKDSKAVATPQKICHFVIGTQLVGSD